MAKEYQLDLDNMTATLVWSYQPLTYTGGNGYVVPTKLASDDNGTFTRTNAAQAVTFVSTSSQGYGTVTAVCDSTGRLGSFTYTGDFQ